MSRSVITLLTDFGARDHYVAAMKGVILGMNPQCTVVDITHQVNPQDIEEGAFILAHAYSYFPKGTIHVAVVDPGVGGVRKPILLVTRNYFFVGPDNGLLTLASGKEEVKEVIELTKKKFFLPRISTTFHGRDIFAPIAAHLSMGVRPALFGGKLDSWVSLDFAGAEISGRDLVGQILHIDAFGNLISNIGEDQLLEFAGGNPFLIRAGRRTMRGLRRGYWEAKSGEAIALIGSGGFLEISVREGDAGRLLRIKKGDKIIVQASRGGAPRALGDKA
jgi:S-adenosyl-L-methionine hydrolase (adenosine-forming)